MGGLLLIVTLAMASAPPMAQEVAPTGAFGFRVGEERRYVLGPAESLYAGESAEWSLRLERVVAGDGDGPRASFAFGHERIEVLPGALDPTRQLLNVRVNGRLEVNLDGFPLLVEFTETHDIAGEEMSQYGRRFIRFSYEDGRLRKDVRFDNQAWDFSIGLARHSTLDREAPRGLFLYLPSALGCLGVSREGPCTGADPAFANPGFLSLLVPALLEEDDGERDFVFFLPSSIEASPFRRLQTGRWLSRERDNLSNIDRYFDVWKLELGASEQIEVGDRTMHSWEIDMGGGIDKLYIEPEGRVLRVDLEKTFGNHADRWIRLVFASEAVTGPGPGV